VANGKPALGSVKRFLVATRKELPDDLVRVGLLTPSQSLIRECTSGRLTSGIHQFRSVVVEQQLELV
jgi:hypothetical protein